jgi:heat shock protein HslJ
MITGIRPCIVAMSTLLLLLGGCAVFASGLAGSEWRPVQVGERVPPDSSNLFVRFEAGGRLSGHNGCNGFFGAYEITGDRIAIGPLGATRRACEEAVMALETAFMQALEQARGFARDGTRLEFTDEQGDTSAIFIQTDWD